MWTDRHPMLHYCFDGEGPHDVLLLHEMGGSLRSWDQLVALADRHFRFIRYDQRGFGFSEKPRADYGLAALLDDARQILDVAQVDGRFSIAAAAGACPLAVELARAMPDRVSGLLLASPTLEMDEAVREQTRQRADTVAEAGMASITDQAMARMFPPPTRNTAFSTYRHRFLANDPVSFALANRALATMAPVLEDVLCPVRVLAGRHDIRAPEQVAAAASRFRHVNFEIIENGGHVLPVQAPDSLALALTAFRQN